MKLYPVFDGLAWATVMAVVTCEGAAVGCVRLVGVGLGSLCVGGHDRFGRCSGLCSIRRRGISHAPLWPSRQLRALIRCLIAWSSWTQPATVVARKKVEGAAPGFLFFGRKLSQPMWWGARQVMSLLWPLFAYWAWDKTATVVAGTRGEGASLASVLGLCA